MANRSQTYLSLLVCLILTSVALTGCAAVQRESNGAPAPLQVAPSVAIDLPPVATEVPPTEAFVLPTATPQSETVVEEVATEGSVAEASVAESQSTDAPPADTPTTDAPTTDTPTTDTPTTGTPTTDAPFAAVEGGASNQRAGNMGSDRYYAVVAPFDTVRDDITLDELRTLWQGGGTVLAAQDALDLLPPLLGTAGAATTAIDAPNLIGALEAERSALGVIPFGQIDPRFKVLTVDGVNLLSNHLQEGAYPLIAAGAGGNRDPNKLTTLVMTGVTAIARGSAAAIVRAGRTTYPAEIIGPELALADITHASNEIPFIEGCEVRNFENNLILCSDPSYWDTLALMGTDIVGLSGNHVNDFGRDGARESLTWYKENDIPIYGSGFTVDEACAPLLWEDHGNTFAFIAALAFGPESAWVTDSEPGACYYYEHKDRIINTIRLLSQAVDVVAVELQYEETYFPSPTPNQVTEFRELRDAGADIVTGVQSHVPQAQEPYGAYDAGGSGMISYGLGNLFFDQMWSWATRTELYARHAIYDGKLINTEIMTGVLEDYAQPRWTTLEERADLLETIFDGAPARP